ncbi:MAG: hypothetical protein PVF83_07715 [Anaerolineales bacterium]
MAQLYRTRWGVAVGPRVMRGIHRGGRGMGGKGLPTPLRDKDLIEG